ncbi:hypothetical protein E4U53_008147 [Claviceps sorghi]|nr:hypothetical protein E4U53_008147 [Claviceps sorghi]
MHAASNASPPSSLLRTPVATTTAPHHHRPEPTAATTAKATTPTTLAAPLPPAAPLVLLAPPPAEKEPLGATTSVGLGASVAKPVVWAGDEPVPEARGVGECCGGIADEYWAAAAQAAFMACVAMGPRVSLGQLL